MPSNGHDVTLDYLKQISKQIQKEKKATIQAPSVPNETGLTMPVGAQIPTPTLLIAAFILTWIIGLTPPILIRYVFIRQPMSKKAAIVTAVFFYFINLFLFIAIGSKSKSHAAVFLIAFVSYWILRKKRRPKKCAPSNKNKATSTELSTATNHEASTKGNSWWRNRSRLFRIWVFVSIVWIVTVLFYMLFFDPEETIYSISTYRMDEREVVKLFIIMAIPLIAGGLKYVYDKVVK